MREALPVASSCGGVHVRSALPGRYRLWVAALYRNDELKRELENALNVPARCRIEANVISGTVLVMTSEPRPAQALSESIQSVVSAFAAARAITLAELERRGRARPLYLSLYGPRRSGSPFGAAFREIQKKQQPAQAAGEAQPVHPWHALSALQVAALLGADSARGLSRLEVGARLQRFSPNVLARIERRAPLVLFVDQFRALPVALLAGSTILSMLTGGVADGLVILGVIVINGVIGFVTESTAERSIASLTRGDAPDVEVIREGEAQRVSIEGIVPGDLISLRPGSRVPADARLIRARDLTVDESALTGESMPVTKSVAAVEHAQVALADRHNMVYRGTLVTGGSGSAVVVATGSATQVGQLQAMVGEVARPETPMQKQLRDLGERTVVMAGVVCGGVLAVGLLRGHTFGVMMRTAVSLAVAAVPEGLPTVAITTLALGIRRMKAEHVIVRRLDAIETLGSVQVLCFDKTGTITENRMRVVRATAADESLSVDGGKMHIKGRELRLTERPELEWLLNVGALCSEAELVENGEEPQSASGSSTEAALVNAALAAGVDVAQLRLQYPLEQAEYRTEQRKLMVTVHRVMSQPGHLLAMKGSPAEVLERCRFWMRQGEVVVLSEHDRRLIRRQNEHMAGEALRVLGMAYAEGEGEPEPLQTELIWLGMVGLADPPRDGLPELIARFRGAGVKTVMITGDQSATAYAVARQIGLDADGELQTLDSVELERMEPEVLAELAPRVQVFSRVSPRHKLRIVQSLQKSGLVVAMTGDGINDCPALKAADIGVAMGGGGATVARDVADIILAKDDLWAMLTAIEQGRVIHADIKKAVRFILTTNVSEILFTLLTVAAGFGEGMSPVQLLWINLISDIFPELALALQPPEHDLLEQPPRDPDAKMFGKQELQHMALEGGFLTLGALAVYGYGISRHGVSPQTRSLSFVALSAAQLLQAFSTRSERRTIFDQGHAAPNPYLALSIGGGIGLTVLAQLLPLTRSWLGGGRRMPLLDWAVAAAGALGPLCASELTKAVRYSAQVQRGGREPSPAATE